MAIEPITRTVDDFLIQGSKKLPADILANIPILQEEFDLLPLKDLSVRFEGKSSTLRGSTPFNMGKTVAGEEAGRTTVTAVFDEKTFQKLFGSKKTDTTRGFFTTLIGSETEDILKKAGIKYGPNVDSLIALNPDMLKSSTKGRHL